MPKNGNSALKRAIRARMAETGEPYNVARRKILTEAEVQRGSAEQQK